MRYKLSLHTSPTGLCANFFGICIRDLLGLAAVDPIQPDHMQVHVTQQRQIGYLAG
tara:strand:+ start:864 stop:1031 length:168 start_codon:yes stop_codon:yes gene_type:complete